MDKTQFDTWIKQYASDNQFGVSMIPAHTHSGADSLHVNYNNLDNKTRFMMYRILNPTVSTSVGNVVGGDWVAPFTGYITDVGATVDTAGTTGTTTIDINKNGSSIMTTKITIDSAEKTSRTAATPSVINGTMQSFQLGDIFTFDVDAINTTPAKGLTVFMNLVQT